MAKNFDIYLRRYLVEGNVLIYTLTYHDGVSGTSRLILDAALNDSSLRKFSGGRTGMAIDARLDQLLKTRIEKLKLGTKINSSVEFEAIANPSLKNEPIVIDAAPVSMISRAFENAYGGLIIATAPLDIQATSSPDIVYISSLINADVYDTTKYSLLSVESILNPDAIITQIGQMDYIEADISAILHSDVKSLCYCQTCDGGNEMGISALVLGTRTPGSLGIWYDGLSINSVVAGTLAKMFAGVESGTAITQEAEGTFFNVLYPEDDVTIIETPDVNIGTREYRLLRDIDNLKLADIDSMTLEELDYIWTF